MNSCKIGRLICCLLPRDVCMLEGKKLCKLLISLDKIYLTTIFIHLKPYRLFPVKLTSCTFFSGF